MLKYSEVIAICVPHVVVLHCVMSCLLLLLCLWKIYRRGERKSLHARSARLWRLWNGIHKPEKRTILKAEFRWHTSVEKTRKNYNTYKSSSIENRYSWACYSPNLQPKKYSNITHNSIELSLRRIPELGHLSCQSDLECIANRETVSYHKWLD